MYVDIHISASKYIMCIPIYNNTYRVDYSIFLSLYIYKYYTYIIYIISILKSNTRYYIYDRYIYVHRYGNMLDR